MLCTLCFEVGLQQGKLGTQRVLGLVGIGVARKWVEAVSRPWWPCAVARPFLQIALKLAADAPAAPLTLGHPDRPAHMCWACCDDDHKCARTRCISSRSCLRRAFSAARSASGKSSPSKPVHVLAKYPLCCDMLKEALGSMRASTSTVLMSRTWCRSLLQLINALRGLLCECICRCSCLIG